MAWNVLWVLWDVKRSNSSPRNHSKSLFLPRSQHSNLRSNKTRSGPVYLPSIEVDLGIGINLVSSTGDGEKASGLFDPKARNQ